MTPADRIVLEHLIAAWSRADRAGAASYVVAMLTRAARLLLADNVRLAAEVERLRERR